MSWRGTRGGIAAARRRHEVIMTPSTYLYFDKESHRFVRRTRQSEQQPPAAGKNLRLRSGRRDRTRRPALPAGRTGQPCGPNSSEPKGARASSSCRASTRWPKLHGRPSSASRGRDSPRCAFRPLARIDASGEPYRLPAPLGIEDGTSEGESFSFVIRPPVSRLQSPLHAQRRRTAGFRP